MQSGRFRGRRSPDLRGFLGTERDKIDFFPEHEERTGLFY